MTVEIDDVRPAKNCVAQETDTIKECSKNRDVKTPW